MYVPWNKEVLCLKVIWYEFDKCDMITYIELNVANSDKYKGIPVELCLEVLDE